ncbi:MAG TPA: hypothetical protein VII99_13020 [Bacteroidia bacterium]
MNLKPVQIFAFIMSFVYLILGLLILFTPLMNSVIEDQSYRTIFGGAILGYGLVRVIFFVRKNIKKS